MLSRIGIHQFVLFFAATCAGVPGGYCGEGNAAVAEKGSASERVLAEARRILTTHKSSEYSHKTKVDEEAGSYAVDCSGLVCVILKKVASEQYKLVPKGKHARPLAFEFHDAFAAAPTDPAKAKGWVRIEKLIDARPGDLIAWRRVELTPGEGTGHVVLVDEPPVRENDGQIRVTLIDSTGSGHGSDTRGDGETGVGRGTIWFTVNEEGRPVAHRWKSRNGKAHETPIAIGRVADLP